MRMFIFLILLSALPISQAFAEVLIKDLDFSKNKKDTVIRLFYEGKMEETPQISYRNKNIRFEFPQAFLRSKINKKIALFKGRKKAEILLYAYKKNHVRLNLALPFESQSLEGKIALSLKDNVIEISIPRKIPAMVQRKRSTPSRSAVAASAAVTRQEKKVNRKKPSPASNNSLKLEEKQVDSTIKKLSLDEQYLAELEKENKKEINPKKKAQQKSLLSDSSDNEFSVGTYAVKVTIFLIMVVGLFYAVMHLFKRGVSRKTKLGFLSKADLIEVLATHHLGPKKSLMLIRVHEQIFLVSDSDKGIEFLQEVQGTNKLLKEGERKLTGDNFDTSLINESSGDSGVKLKEDIYQSDSVLLSEKSKNRFSSQLKEKVKNLKPLSQ